MCLIKKRVKLQKKYQKIGDNPYSTLLRFYNQLVSLEKKMPALPGDKQASYENTLMF